MDWHAVFWDFDGVVLDSVHVKTRAFARMFSKYGSQIEKKVVDYHLANGGISRFEKFRYYYNVLLDRPISEEEVQSLGNEFSLMVLEEVLAAPFIPGALDTLQNLLEKGIPSYVVSGTPEDEVIHIVKARQLSRFFSEVHGSPMKKVDIVTDILRRRGHHYSKCLFLGDAMTDYEAAKTTGVDFLGIVAEGDMNHFPEGTKIVSRIDIKEMIN